MARFIRKLDDFVFDRGTIAWPNPLNLSAIEGRPREVVANRRMPFGRGVGDIAGDLFAFNLLRHEGKRSWIRIAELRLKLRPIDGAGVESRRCSGLQPLPFEPQRAQLIP